MRQRVRPPVRRRAGAATVAALCGLAASGGLAGCGGSSPPAPVSVTQLLSDATTLGTAGTQVSVLTATGTGSRRFPTVLPRHLEIEMSCRGGRTVRARINGREWVAVYCAAGQAGGSTERFDRPARLSIVASPGTRWSLAVLWVRP